MVCGRPHLVRSAVQTMRRRPPSGWAACQLCNDGAQSCEDSPVRGLFTGKLGLMTGRAKTKSVRCERFSPGSWNCDAGDATADPVNRLAERVCHAGQSDYSLHLYGHMHIFFVHATVLVGIRRFYHITPPGLPTPERVAHHSFRLLILFQHTVLFGRRGFQHITPETQFYICCSSVRMLVF